ncbi:MAG: hypothetical protein WBB67_12115 [bacterium]
MLIRQKLVQACRGLGLNLLEISKFVQISEYPDVACWGFDLEKKKHYIYINPRVLRLPVGHIQLILKHEILHYAGYRNLEYAKDFVRANIAFDIVINKILTIVHEREMKALCRRIYPPETRANTLVLARPDVNPDDLKTNKRLWLAIWHNPEIPSPASLYYQIASPVRIKNNPFSANGIICTKIIFRQIPDDSRDDRLSKLSSEVVDDVMKKFQGNGFSAVKFSAAFRQIFVNKKSFDSRSVEEFISELESRQTLEEISARIITALDNQSSRQLYPYELSRIGIIYVACGVSKRLPIFWNKTPESRKKNLAVYVDTSPSMECYQEKEVFLIDRLKGFFPTKIHCFANDVREISLDDFANGSYEEGYSTSFDAVIEHLLGSEFDAGVVFTDGFSYVNSENENRFKQSRKRLFTVYFTDDGDVESELDSLSEQTMTVKLD